MSAPTANAPCNFRLSYAHGASDVPLLGETIGENLRRTVQRYGAREALVVRSQDFRASYDELWRLVDRAARALLALGVRKGDRVGIWAPNRYEWVIVQYATARVGAILVNINPAYLEGELEYALNQSGISALFMATAFKNSSYATMLAAVRGNCPRMKHALVLEDDWAAFMSSGDGVSDTVLDKREATLQFDDPINIQYTSGTTGEPKGATLTHHSILNNAWFTAQKLRYTEADRVCIPVPFYHCFGMVFGNLACTATGACMVIPGESFDPLTALETVQAERCTSLYGVPTMFIAELEHPRFAEFNLSSLRTGVMAGSLCPEAVMKKVIDRMNMREVAIAYGMTETSPASTLTTIEDGFERRVTTVGRAMPHVEVKIVDVTGSVVPRGATGEFCARGYHVMRGYWDNEKATRASIVAGWMHTGDLATMDDQGYVRITGRIKDLIIRGGENIYPREIEDVLLTHPAVSDAQVIGVPSEKYGEEVMAWVRLRRGQQVDEAALIAHCKDKIARHKIPRYWRFTDAFPMTVTGKIQKFRMRELALESLGLLP